MPTLVAAAQRIAHWLGNLGVRGDYVQIGPIKGELNPWEGFWAAREGAAGTRNATLTLSEPAAAR